MTKGDKPGGAKGDTYDVSSARDLPRECARALAALLDLSESSIGAAWDVSREAGAYRAFRLDADRPRIVHVPSEPLADLQRRALHRVLYNGPISPAAYAGVRGRSLLDAARCHFERAQEVIKVDIADAYASTSYRHVFTALRRRLDRDVWVLGLDGREAKQVARALTLLLTVARGRGAARRLPMGSPTSVSLFNLVCLDLDSDVVSLLDAKGRAEDSIYTRYVDDLVVSSARALPRDLGERLCALIRRAGFTAHRGKLSRERGFGATIHGFRRTFRGVEPTEEALNRYANFIRLHLDRVAKVEKTGRGTELARQSAFALRGMDAFLTQVYESRGALRPDEIRFDAPAAPESAPLRDHEDLWD